MQNLLAQIYEHGGEINKVAVVEIEPENNGLFATEDIAYGENLAYVPRELIITSKEAQASPTVQLLKEKNILGEDFTGKIEHTELTIYLLEESRKPSSKWFNYIAVQPRDWSNLTLLYNQEDQEFLKGSPILHETLKMKDALTKKYELISTNVPDFSSKFSLTEFVEMYRGVTTRTFSLFMNDKDLDESTKL